MGRSSPPTDRVVAVLNLLAEADRGLGASEVARRLDITLSTCSSLLRSLGAADFVERDADKTYRLGPGLLPLVEAIAERFPLLGQGNEALRSLSAELECGVTLTKIMSDHLRVVVAVGAEGRAPLGVRAGDQFPLAPPYGAIAMAWQPAHEVDRWLEGWPPSAASADEGAHERQVMEDIAASGVGVWSLEPYAVPLVSRIRSIIEDLADDAAAEGLRDQLTDLFAVFGRRGYTLDELAARRAMSVGYALAAVFGPDGRPQYQIDLHVLRRSLRHQEVRAILERLWATAEVLTGVVGGRVPRRVSTSPGTPARRVAG